MAKFYDRQKLKQFLLCVIPGAAAAALVLFACAARPMLTQRADYAVYDTFLEHTAGGEPSDVPVLVDIDEKSLKQYGQWPWPRYMLGEILARLTESGAAAIGVDILTSEQDRTSPALMLRRMEQDFGVKPKAFAPSEYMDNDKMMADILKQTPSVLSAFLSTEALKPSSPVPGVKIVEARSDGALPFSDYLSESRGLIMPLPVLAKDARAVGFMNADGDPDGFFRRMPLFLKYNGKPIPSLGLAALALAANGGKELPQFLVRLDADGPVSVSFCGITIPLSRGASLPILFRRAKNGAGSGIFHKYSAADIIDGKVAPEQISGKVVFVGSTTAGLKDLRPTPFDTAYPGLELHAAFIDTILSKRFVTAPSWQPGAEFLITLIAALTALAFFGLAAPAVYLSYALLAALGLWYGSLWVFVNRGFFFTPVYPIAALVLSGFLISAARFWTEEKSKRMLKRAFSNYVSPEIVTRIVKRGGLESLRGEQREITILFTDIRGFTSLTEGLSPTQVVEMLVRYFTPMTSIVRGSGGTLDKFVGDALMAFWNAPVDVPGHARRAVQSLLDMHIKLAELNVSLQRDMGIKLAMGGGIHTGNAQVGNMGTAELMNYTAIGDAVNTASRVEGMCSKYGSTAVVSGETRAQCENDFAWHRIDIVRVKGREHGVELWHPMSFEEAAQRAPELERWERAFSLYEAADFAASRDICAELVNEYNGIKLYKVFLERCADLLNNVPTEWDGIFNYESK